MNNYLFFTFTEIIFSFILIFIYFINNFLQEKNILYILFIIGFFILKKIRNVSLFTPEYGVLIAYTLFFIIPFYFYQNGILLQNQSSMLAMKESFKLFLIINLISVLFYFQKSKKSKLLYVITNSEWDISYIKLIYTNSIVLIFRLFFLVFGYKTNAISSLGKFSIIDIIYIPIFQGSILLFFLSLWEIFLRKKESIVLKIQLLLFFFFDIFYLSKGRLLLYLLIIMLVLYIKEKKLSIKYLLISAFGIIFFFPIAQYFRFCHSGLIQTDIWSFLKFSFSNYKFLLNLIIGRLNMVTPFSKIIDNDLTDLLDHYPLQNTLFPFLFISLIPRFVWPERLDSSIGGLVGYYLGYINDPTISQVTISILGEFYLNFKEKAFLFIIIFAFFINSIYYAFLYKRKVVYVYIGIFFYFFNILTGLESYFVVRTVVFIKLLVVYSMFYFFIKNHKKRRGTNECINDYSCI